MRKNPESKHLHEHVQYFTCNLWESFTSFVILHNIFENMYNKSAKYLNKESYKQPPVDLHTMVKAPFLPGQVVSPPDRVQSTDDGAGLGEVEVLELAVPHAGVHRLLPEVLQGDLRLRPDVLQLNLRCHIHSQGIDKDT